MLVGFKRQFAPFVENGSKTHTIRALRGDGKVPKVGETLHCYVDPRQKTMRLLGMFRCVMVERIEITRHNGIVPLLVSINGLPLTDSEAKLFFHRDGFRGETSSPIHQAAEFWKDRESPFCGNLIHWNPENITK